MNTREQLIKARLGLLQLAEELDNVKLASKRAGISRSHFYEIKEAFEKFGRNGLAPQPKRRPSMPNQTPPEVEQQILDMSARYPTFSYVRISGQLKLAGFGISPSTVRAVWQRNGLLHRSDRLLWLERRCLEQGGPVLTDNQIRLLRLHRGRTCEDIKRNAACGFVVAPLTAIQRAYAPWIRALTVMMAHVFQNMPGSAGTPALIVIDEAP